jgi:hypothetical protein
MPDVNFHLQLRREVAMLNQSTTFAFVVALAASTLPGWGHAQAQQSAPANLAGAYRCEPQPSPCPWPGQTMAITQTGSDFELKNDQGSFAHGQLTSDFTVSGSPPWNANGLVLPDHAIEWSNGTSGKSSNPEKCRDEVEATMSRIQASRWLSVSGLLLSSGFILALVFR